MKKKNNNPVANRQIIALQKKVSKLSVKKNPPFADAGGLAGTIVGGMFNRPNLGRSVGRYLGSGIGGIFGSGDYTMTNMQPSYNVLTNGAQIPQFDRTRHSTVISHREYLGDITGTSAFTIREYPINPGMSNTFPWLASVANQFQEYRIHGMIFEFRPLITDFITAGQPGVVVMATNYNAEAPAYTTKQQMENSEFAVSVKPTCNLIHGVECAGNQTILPQRYVRNGSLVNDVDLQLYDYGKFQFATQGNPTVIIGELWVSYTIEFFKPILTPDLAQDAHGTHLKLYNVTTTNPCGSLTATTGNLAVTTTTSSFRFPTQDGARYLVIYTLSSTSSDMSTSSFGFGMTGANTLNYFSPGTSVRVASTLSSGNAVFIAETLILGAGVDAVFTPTINNLGAGTVTCDLLILEISGTIVA